MKEIIDFFKDIFMISNNDSKSIGLSQFKTESPVEKPVKKENFFMQSKSVKISDLMRKSV